MKQSNDEPTESMVNAVAYSTWKPCEHSMVPIKSWFRRRMKCSRCGWEVSERCYRRWYGNLNVNH